MLISDIKQQVKRADRYSIYADGKYVFSLSEAGILELGIHVGRQFEDGELERLKDSADTDKLYDRALHYIMMRPRSHWEMETYFKRKQATPSQQQIVFEKLDANRLLDDYAFAKSWVDSRRLLKSTSKRRLSQELRAKRVTDDIISKVLDEDESDERSVLYTLAEKKYRLSRYQQDEMKLMQYLVRQGFRYDDVKSVVAELRTGGDA